jgi:hypothetical protein
MRRPRWGRKGPILQAVHRSDPIVYDRSPFNPTPTTPVSAALVFTPDITLMPTPTPIRLDE